MPTIFVTDETLMSMSYNGMDWDDLSNLPPEPTMPSLADLTDINTAPLSTDALAPLRAWANNGNADFSIERRRVVFNEIAGVINTLSGLVESHKRDNAKMAQQVTDFKAKATIHDTVFNGIRALLAVEDQ
ncbi:hypothetical protein Kuura_045 [Caulobacter phage Kuura]|nr:hypothetical protein Kuura_045 [Caulobacter phage Kuura]